ncbi:MAG TPA: hypothetical protein VM534_09215, partial [Thermoanaerobaculia bacterium]|nr:hypothetical protein [Thermoanaerobaculia bacterium]
VDSPPFELHRIAVGAPDSGRPIWKEKAERDTTGIAVSPDGRTLAFVLTEPETGTNLYTRPIDGSEPPRAIRATSSEESNASFSPDGRWIVYQSDETGRPELYVEPFPGPGQRVQITADGGHSPLWAGNGEILYRSAGEMRVISTRLDGRFEFDPRRPLFDHDILDEDTTTFDVTADGSLVLAVTMPEINRPRQIEMVTDWAAELNRLAPARR